MTKLNEPAHITIANLKRDIHNLMQRCTDLVLARDEAIRNRSDMVMQRDILSRKIAEMEAKAKTLDASVNYSTTELNYSRGYIARVKEVDAHFMPIED